MADLLGTEIGEYKSKVFHELVYTKEDNLSEEIVKAIDPEYFNYEDEMLYEYIFPYLRVPEIETETKSYVLLSVNVPNVSTVNYFFKEIVITIMVVVHQDLMKMKAGTNRTRADYIGERINKIFNRNKNISDNEPLEYVSDVEGVLLNKYHTRTIKFRTKEVNNMECGMDRLNMNG